MFNNIVRKKLEDYLANSNIKELFDAVMYKTAFRVLMKKADFAYISFYTTDNENLKLRSHTSFFNKIKNMYSRITKSISDHERYFNKNKNIYPVYPLYILQNYKYEKEIHIWPESDLPNKTILKYNDVFNWVLLNHEKIKHDCM